MIVFISDLHLTDGTFDYRDPRNERPEISHDISVEAFRLFWDDIHRIAYANPEANVKELRVVLLGDIFELRSTTRWVASDYDAGGARRGLGNRTWREDRARPSRTCVEILDAILRNNEERLDYLTTNRLSRIPRDSGLALFSEKKVDVRFEYVVGNHDSLVIFHEDPALRDMITSRLGWTIVPARGAAFPPGTRYVLDSLGIVAEHGHRGDDVDFYNDSFFDPPLGALLPDTFGRLMYHIQRIPPEREASRRTLVQVGMNIDNVRPSADALNWLEANVPADPAARGDLRTVLRTGLEEIVADADPLFAFLYPRVKGLIRKLPWFARAWLAVAGLFTSKERMVKSAVLKGLRAVIDRLKKDEAADPLPRILADLRTTFGGMASKGGAKNEAPSHYFRNAEAEADAAGAKFVVYGHSHQFEIVPLKAVANRKSFYFNSGTWKKTIQRNLCCPGFQQWARMTYLNIYDVERRENKDHIFDLWHGNLQFKDDA